MLLVKMIVNYHDAKKYTCESNCSKQTACDSEVMKFIDYKQTLTVLSLSNFFRGNVFWSACGQVGRLGQKYIFFLN